MKKIKLYKIIALFILVACFGACVGCSNAPASIDPPAQEKAVVSSAPAPAAQPPSSPNPEAALKRIYSGLSGLTGVLSPTTPEVIEMLDLAPQAVAETAVRYVDGDFGVSDVYIIRPASGEDSKGVGYRTIVNDALQERKDLRIREFESYDVYNSTVISENGLIFERGGYVVLLILEDNNAAREIIEKYIPEKLEIA